MNCLSDLIGRLIASFKCKYTRNSYENPYFKTEILIVRDVLAEF